MKYLLITLALFARAPVQAAVPRAEDPVFAAMTAELERSFKQLAHAEKVPLYFIQYEATDIRRLIIHASNGAIIWDQDKDHERFLDVDMRVGSRHLDNTHQFKGPNGWEGGRPENKFRIPIEDDVDALRAAIWEQTDRDYRDAQERYVKVVTNHAVTAQEEDSSDDFSSPEKPIRFSQNVSFRPPDAQFWRERLRKLSLRFRGHPFIYNSYVTIFARAQTRWLLNSEGARIKDGRVVYNLSYGLKSQTDDGMSLERGKTYVGERLEDLPDEAQVLRDMDQSIQELASLKDAPVVQPYTGPVILKNRAAAVYFHEVLGHRLEGHRQKNEAFGQTFAKKLGQPIVASIISVYDDPTMERFRGEAIESRYLFDEEGIPARRTLLVQDGILRGFLMSRSPIAAAKNSNGHGRREVGFPIVARMGTLFVEPSHAVSYAQLREMLIAEVKKQKKPYGFIIDDMIGGETNTTRFEPQTFKGDPLLVYRVYPDGRPDETVRGVNIIGTPLAAFTKILAAADDATVFHGLCGAESGHIPQVNISPSILVSEMEIEKKQKSETKPPILPPPF